MGNLSRLSEKAVPFSLGRSRDPAARRKVKRYPGVEECPAGLGSREVQAQAM